MIVELLMNKLSKYKSVGVSVLIGIAGSGLWSFISETLAPQITAYFITVSSSFSQKIFIEISTHDLTTLQQSTYSLLSLIFILLIGVMCASVSLLMLSEKERLQKIREKAYTLGQKFTLTEDREDSSEINHEDVVNSYNAICSDLEKTDKKLQKTQLVTNIMLFSSFIILTIVFLYNSLTYRYIHESTVYFDYLLKVNAVNLNDEDERKYISRFTQIRNSKDYTTIIVELEKLALYNKLSILPNLIIRDEREFSKDHPNSKSVPLDNFQSK